MMPSTPLPLFDAGLQPERTALAWRRTALALAVGALIAIRIVPSIVGIWTIVPAGVGLVLALSVLAVSHRRYRRLHRALVQGSPPESRPDGALVALTAAATLVIGLAAVFVVVRGLF